MQHGRQRGLQPDPPGGGQDELSVLTREPGDRSAVKCERLCAIHGLHAIRNAKLAEHVLQVPFHRFRPDLKRAPDFLVAQAPSDQREHFAFTGAQGLEERRRRPLRV